MISWSYIAAFIDCDGWVSSSGNRYYIGLTQSLDFKKEMQIISDFLNKNNINHSFLERISNTVIGTIKRSSPMVNIVISEQNSLKILCEKIIDYSLIKKQKVQNCLNFCTERLNKRAINKDCIRIQDKKLYWNNEEINVLLSMKNQNYSHKAIAIELNRSKNSIAQKLSKLNIK